MQQSPPPPPPPAKTTLLLPLLLLLAASAAQARRDGGGVSPLEEVFRLRSEADWRAVWHVESHARCRQRLQRHMALVCAKDIYRADQDEGEGEGEGEDEAEAADVPEETNEVEPLLAPGAAARALGLLARGGRRRRRRRRDASITAECCARPRGCTWEEYAEYCPAPRRPRRHFAPVSSPSAPCEAHDLEWSC
ncbi:hypothetical protein R5R35_013801 [Gryllus longicercus]|uniref:Insulin-like peptide 7 n=1 Tax=Gryllus longicercus TaxID=2509291 RepID=A0AAN9VW49_9ORTH